VRFALSATDSKRHPVSAAALAIVAMVAGFAFGALVQDGHGTLRVTVVATFEIIGHLWLNALLMTSVPLVISLVAVAVIGTGDANVAGKLGARTLLWFVLLLFGAGVGAVVAGAALVHWFPASIATRAAMHASLGPAARPSTVTGGGSLRGWVESLIPGNLVHALANGEILPTIVATLLFAMAARWIAEPHRLLLHRMFEALADVSLTLTRILLRLLPLAIFALTFTAAAGAGTTVVGGVAYFVIAVTVLLIVATALIYPLTWWFGGVTPRRFARAVWPCQVVALTTRSSLAALPSLLERGQTQIGLPFTVASFVLPLSVSVFKLNRTISSPLKVIVLSHLYGVPVDSGIKLLFILIALFLSFGTPGLPSGGAMITLPFYVAAGIPLEGVVLLNAVDAIPDLFKTVLNVTADLGVAAIVARAAGFTLRPAPVPAPASGESLR
jgi:proton glutamate symport protein